MIRTLLLDFVSISSEGDLIDFIDDVRGIGYFLETMVGIMSVAIMLLTATLLGFSAIV